MAACACPRVVLSRSGDWFYQVVEITALALTGALIYHVVIAYPTSYDDKHDRFGGPPVPTQPGTDPGDCAFPPARRARGLCACMCARGHCGIEADVWHATVRVCWRSATVLCAHAWLPRGAVLPHVHSCCTRR